MKILLLTVILLAFVAFSTIQMGQAPLSQYIPEDSLQAERDFYLAQLKLAIAGKENMPVDSVFRNLKVFGGFPAGNLLIAMNSWSRALGVSCKYCHSPEDWSLDNKPAKDIGRQMSEMSTKINSELLSKITGLNSERHIINCTSCHNGKLKPALRIGN